MSTISFTDAVDSIKTLLTANWNNANTDSNTPIIDAITNVKERGGFTDNQDQVLMYEGRSITTYNSLSFGSRNFTTPLTIDIRTSVSRSRFIKMIKEVDRIINSFNVNHDADYNLLESDTYIDKSDKRKSLWRGIYDVKLIKASEII